MFAIFTKLFLAARFKARSAKRRASRADTQDAPVPEDEYEYEGEREDIDIRARATNSPDSHLSSPPSSPSPPPSPISPCERAFIPTPPAPVRRHSACRLVQPRYVELDRMRARGPDGDHVERLGQVDNKTFRANAWHTAAAYAALHDPTALLAAPPSAAPAAARTTTVRANVPTPAEPSVDSADARRPAAPKRPRPDAIYVLGELDINPRVPRGARIPVCRPADLAHRHAPRAVPAKPAA